MHFLKTSLTAVALATVLAACAQTGTTAASSAPSASASVAANVQRKEIAPGIYELAYSARQKAVFVTTTGGSGEGAAQPRILRLDPNTLAVQAEIVLPLRGFGVAIDDQANRLYVGNTLDAAVTVVDIASNSVVGTVKLVESTPAKNTEAKDGKGERPPHFRELVLDSAQHRLYMPGLGNDSALYVVDTQALKLEKVVPGLGRMATGATLDAKKGRLFVSNFEGKILTIDTASLSIVKTFDSGVDKPLNIAYDAASNRLYATAQDTTPQPPRQPANGAAAPAPAPQPAPAQPARPGNLLAVIDADSGKSVANVSTGKSPLAAKVDESRKHVFVSNRGEGTVSLVDASTLKVLKTVELPTYPNSLALDERSNVLYVSVKNGRDAAKGALESVARIQY